MRKIMFAAVAICLGVTVFGLTMSRVANATTVSYWRFEEGVADAQAVGAGSVLDETLNNNDGTPVGNPFYRSDVPADPVPLNGLSNKLSLDLDGAGDYVSISHSPSLNLSDGFTIEFWMKARASNNGKIFLVMDKSHGFTDSTGWLFQGNTLGNLDFGIGNGGGGAGDFSAATSTVNLLDDEWHHVAGIFDSTDSGQEIKLFIDGLLDATGTAPGLLATNTRDINIGAAWGGGSATRFFDGSVDEVRISSSILAPSQFLNASTDIPEPGALALLGVALAGLGYMRRRGLVSPA